MGWVAGESSEGVPVTVYCDHSFYGLIPGDLYEVQPMAVNPIGIGKGTPLTFMTKPLPPSDLTVQATKEDSVTVSWTRYDPADRGATGVDAKTKVLIKKGEPPSGPEDTTVDSYYYGYDDSYTFTGLESGETYYIRAYTHTAEGAEERWSDPAEIDGGITMGSNLPPVADAGGSYSGDIGEVIQLDGSKSRDIDGSIVNYEWDFDYDGTFTIDEAGSDKKIVTHSYGEAGSYTVCLRVTDNDGLSDTDTATVTISSPDAPPSKPEKPTLMSYKRCYNRTQYKFSTNDAGDVDYMFDWGDGTNTGWISDHSALHAWSETGVYDVKVKLKNSNGESDWSDPLAVKIYSKYVIPSDLDPSKPPQFLQNNQNDYLWDTNVNYDLRGAVLIYLFSDDYPPDPAPAGPTGDKGNVAFGTILIVNTGAIEQYINTPSGTYNTILESGSVILKYPSSSSGYIDLCSNFYEKDNVLGITIPIIRSTTGGASGSGIYEIKLDQINSVTREKQMNSVYNVKISIPYGDYKNAWLRYLKDNYKFSSQTGSYQDILIYNNGGETNLRFTTSLIHVDITGIT